MTRWLVAAVLACAGIAPAAAAECDQRIAELAEQAAKVSDVRIKQLVAFDLQRAQKEWDEADDGECKEALDHADGLLNRR